MPFDAEAPPSAGGAVRSGLDRRVTVVAPRYGLSEVGLVKICMRLGVPAQALGY